MKPLTDQEALKRGRVVRRGRGRAVRKKKTIHSGVSSFATAKNPKERAQWRDSSLDYSVLRDRRECAERETVRLYPLLITTRRLITASDPQTEGRKFSSKHLRAVNAAEGLGGGVTRDEGAGSDGGRSALRGTTRSTRRGGRRGRSAGGRRSSGARRGGGSSRAARRRLTDDGLGQEGQRERSESDRELHCVEMKKGAEGGVG